MGNHFSYIKIIYPRLYFWSAKWLLLFAMLSGLSRGFSLSGGGSLAQTTRRLSAPRKIIKTYIWYLGTDWCISDWRCNGNIIITKQENQIKIWFLKQKLSKQSFERDRAITEPLYNGLVVWWFVVIFINSLLWRYLDEFLFGAIHNLIRCWLVANWTLRNNCWNLNQNTQKIFQENSFC